MPRAILLMRDTRHHRRILAESPGLWRAFPLGARQMLAALRAGRDPGGDGIVVL